MNPTYPYWQKQEQPLFPDLAWNFPEQKSNTVTILGGNSQNFAGTIKMSEYLANRFPIRNVKTILPDSLRSKLPFLPNVDFAPSTDSGSFAKSSILRDTINSSDFAILAGDFSRNSATAVAITDAIQSSSQPIIIGRDTPDLIASEMASLLMREQFYIMASLVQLQKIFRAVYYPKMILLSMPLLPIVEALHKFTLSYPCTILTFHQGQIIVANHGNITTTPIESTVYSPISLWSGTLACNIAAFNLWNPNKPLEATTAAILHR